MRLRSIGPVVLAVGVIVCLNAAVVRGQATSTTSETKKFTVIAVDGNDLVVRLPEGTRELTVPEDFRFTVDGKQMSVHELKAGMSGTATITTTTTTTPVTVTEVKNATVANVAASTIIVRTDQGFRSFTQGEIDKRGVKIFRDGKPALVSDFRPGDKLSATIVTTMPPKVMTQREVNATLAASSGAALSAASSAASRTAAAASGTTGSTGTAAPSGAAPARSSGRKLPKTAGSLPLMGLAGVLSLAVGAGLTIRRRRLTQ